jgi:hypothetical protein
MIGLEQEWAAWLKGTFEEHSTTLYLSLVESGDTQSVLLVPTTYE